MASFKILTLDNPDLWRSVLSVDRSVFGSVEFARIASKTTNAEARLFIFSDDHCQVAYPFFLRHVDNLPFARQINGHLGDIQSPEYCGPLLLKGRLQEDPSAFIRTFHDYCLAEGIVAEFARLHPWRTAEALLDSSRVFLNREIVYIDLSHSLEDIWTTSLNHQCRVSIRKARRSGVSIIEGKDKTSVIDFHRIYMDTMRRHQAAEKYRFPLSYFESFQTELPLNSRFVLAKFQGCVVAGSLYLSDEEDLYAYLGGLDVKYQELRPRNALTYEMIKWGKANGKKRLILGGGYRSEDGVFRHKASFSPLRANFCVYKQVHIPEAYARLCNQNHVSEVAENEGTEFFPAYRISEESPGSTKAF